MPKHGEDAVRPWERQENESAPAFEAFRIYLSQGSERSVRSVAQKCNKSISLIARWSTACKWVERARAYDAELQRQAYAEAVKANRKMASRHISLAQAVQTKAVEALKNLDASTLDARDIVAMMREATKLERETRASILAETNPERQQGQDSAGSLADVITEAWKRRDDGVGN